MSCTYWTADSAIVTADSAIFSADSGPITGAQTRFVHSGGTRTLTHASMPPLTRYYAHASEPTSGLAFVRGDGLPNPGPLSVTATVTASELRDAYALAYAIADEATTATSVCLHWGEFLVDGVLGYSMRPDGISVLLTLEFAPTSNSRVTA